MYLVFKYNKYIYCQTVYIRHLYARSTGTAALQ